MLILLKQDTYTWKNYLAIAREKLTRRFVFSAILGRYEYQISIGGLMDLKTHFG